MVSPETDVVIATRNRPEALGRCLAALAAQSYTRFRVIVADDASETPLQQVVDAARRLGLDVVLVRIDDPGGPANARNVGVAAGDAPVIVFIDDDIAAHRNLVEALVTPLLEPEPGAPDLVTFGPFVMPADWRPTPWSHWDGLQLKHEAECLLRGDYAPTWRQFHTGNNALRRSTFLAAGGFDTRFKRAEDDEFGLRLARLGCEFRFQPGAIGLHYAERPLSAWIAIPQAYARFDVLIDRLHPDAGYLAAKQRELARRHPLLRLARAVFARPRIARLAVAATTGTARLLYRARATAPAMLALSVAYDLLYVSTLSRELQALPEA